MQIRFYCNHEEADRIARTALSYDCKLEGSFIAEHIRLLSVAVILTKKIERQNEKIWGSSRDEQRKLQHPWPNKDRDKTNILKNCSCCNLEFHTFVDYITNTKRIPHCDQNIIVYENYGIHIYRNCLCGTTLIVVGNDKRVESPSGLLRRKLFDKIVSLRPNYITKYSAEIMTRTVFKNIIILVYDSIIDYIEAEQDKMRTIS
ncbi:MAG: hypothetical protein R3B45_17765 [Bdellovibrionota bacterium]